MSNIVENKSSLRSVSLMSFNIHGSVYNEGINSWDNRSALNVSTLKKYQPDLIGFQEHQTGNQDVYKTQLPDYDSFIGLSTGGIPFNWNAIYWKKDKFELIDTDAFWLSPTPDIYSVGWDAQQVRAVTQVLLRIRGSDLKLTHINTHFDQISEVARIESAKLIIEKSRTQKHPLIITGDFNCNPYSKPYKQFTDNGFEDLYQDDDSSSYTNHDYLGENYDPSKNFDQKRVDWILKKGRAISLIDSLIITDHLHPLYPSDHYPVMADIKIV